MRQDIIAYTYNRRPLKNGSELRSNRLQRIYLTSLRHQMQAFSWPLHLVIGIWPPAAK